MRFKQVFLGMFNEIYGIADGIPMGFLWHPKGFP